MTANILNFPNRRPLPKATMQASVLSSTVHNHPDGPVLEITLTTRLADVKPSERRALAKLLNGGPPLTVTLSGSAPIPRSHPLGKSNGEGSGGDDAA